MKWPITKHEAIQIIHEYFGQLSKPAVVFNLSELAKYSEYDNVIYFSEDHEHEHDMYPLGYPLAYKHGYQYIPIVCENFIIVTQLVRLYPSYKKINI